MGTGEGGTPTKTSKTSTTQEPPSTPSYAEWAAAFQAYYGPGATPPPPGYFPSTVASGPQPHPYIWGAQPLMPPYGTAPPHAALYTYGGMYGHPPGAHPYGQYVLQSPSTEMTMGSIPARTEAEAKSPEGKVRNGASKKKARGSLGSLGMLSAKEHERAKGTSTSANGLSPSCDSGSDGSTEGSEDTAENGLHTGGASEQGGKDGKGGSLQTGEGLMKPAMAVTGQSGASGPMTNLNIGMDYWSQQPSNIDNKISSKRSSSSTTLVPMVATTDIWLQDERELKRQRRKQSNRESARRSRLRKQAECEELSTRVDKLTVENVALRTELSRLAEECKKLNEENAILLEQVHKVEERVGDGDGDGDSDVCVLPERQSSGRAATQCAA